jgi:NDMA-dependent alcohol dehydrogenase
MPHRRDRATAGARDETRRGEEDSMKAAVLYKPNTPLQVVDVQQQGPQAGEARVRVKAAGVCHSDWHIMNGDWPLPLPMVLGHEAAGIVEEVGAGVTNVTPGDHIIFSFRAHCGRCTYCSSGRSILCDGHTSVRWAMLDGTTRLAREGQDIFQMARIGTFSERVVCPAEMLVPINKTMPWPQAALVGCCVPTGVGAVTRCAHVEAGASVLVIGCGGVGLNVVQGARIAGAATIIACDLVDRKLEFAREFGATHTINAKQDNVVDRVRALTSGRGADYAFDAIGGEQTTLQIVDAVRNGGTAVIVGMAAMAVRAPVTPYTMALQEKTLKGTLYGSVRPNVDFPWLVELYLQGRLKLDQLVSRTYALEEINDGFARMLSGEVARGVVVFN